MHFILKLSLMLRGDHLLLFLSFLFYFFLILSKFFLFFLSFLIFLGYLSFLLRLSLAQTELGSDTPVVPHTRPSLTLLYPGTDTPDNTA